MDILSHTLTGTAVGTVVASFSNDKDQHPLWIILIASFGGALPDFDAISLWSKFDEVFGKLWFLNHTGKEIYFGKYWYSHHAALHSITFAILLPFSFLSTRYLLKNRKDFVLKGISSYLNSKKLLIIAFSIGFTFHLLEDMPTPYCVWGGVRMFFPVSTYYGGFGKIWWWNNYDIFLLIISVILLNSILLITQSFFKLHVRKLCVSIFALGAIISVYQINTRDFDFNYVNHTKEYQTYELKSKEIQQKILGETLYNIMLEFDNSISLNF